MNRSFVSAIAFAAAAVVSGHAMALEAGDRGLGLTNDVGQPVVGASQLSRAEVQADTLRALAAGEIAGNGDRDARVSSTSVRGASTLSREAVRADVLRAAAAGQGAAALHVTHL